MERVPVGEVCQKYSLDQSITNVKPQTSLQMSLLSNSRVGRIYNLSRFFRNSTVQLCYTELHIELKSKNFFMHNFEDISLNKLKKEILKKGILQENVEGPFNFV